ncbi:SacI homology domain-containing protein [Lipomyces oligophaga]|uniref:SacI homology domain-containing protein n=1 Tax=Lipomyces oligophaga TaxID=45792 RepID=UPI0034CD3BEC
MDMRMFYRKDPRTLMIATSDYALSFHCVDTDLAKSSQYTSDSIYAADSRDGTRSNSGVSRVQVDFTTTDTIDMTDFTSLSGRPCYGCLGLIAVDHDVFLAVITGYSKVAEPVPEMETVFRIGSVEFFCVSSSTWDMELLERSYTPSDSTTSLAYSRDGYDINTPAANSNQSFVEHPCIQLRKLLSDGSFYFSNDFDLTSRMQSRNADPSFDIDGFDATFMWNSYMISELLKYRSHLQEDEKSALDQCRLLTSVIRGFAETVNARLDSKNPAKLTVISRQGCRRAGTRYNARGVDDEGNVANFVETETIVYTPQWCFSYTQVRGSVPIFWEQDVQLLSAKVNITRAFEATQPAFNAHFEPLVSKYGPVHIVNLLSVKPGEQELTQRYHKHIEMAESGELAEQLKETWFDFHVETARAGYAAADRIHRFLYDDVQHFGYFLHDRDDKALISEQTGVFRTNCLDCLDRTNLIQQIISRMVMEYFCEQNLIRPDQEFFARHSVLWADNGDQLSKIYAGTGALKTSYTRSGKMSIAGAIADATKSVSRMYINNFVDKGRQNTIDMLLGRLERQARVLLFDPVNDFVAAELNKRQADFTSTDTVSVFAGTFNLNGFLYDGDLSPWLFPKDSGIETPDLIVIAFQEIVELTAGQILNADPARREFWEQQVLRTLKTHDDYVLLRSGQLVGTALFLYARVSKVKYIRNISGAVKKTGLGGMAGNKGAVAFSFDYASTRMCFITSHFAAGQSNVVDRNRDFKTIFTGTRFPRGKQLHDHDTIIWLGDFNYRIDLANEQVRSELQSGELEILYRNDQLNKAMLNGQAFQYFDEAQVHFNPTYKFDNGTDVYDTSEKQRIPAWTDRILIRGSNIKQLSYNSAVDVKFSDHRPIYASFSVTVSTVDEKSKEKLQKELYAKHRGQVGANLLDLAEVNGLPPPSTEKHQWWTEGGQSAKVSILPPGPDMILNPSRPVNPFTPTAHSDFVPQSSNKPRSFVGEAKSQSNQHAPRHLQPAGVHPHPPPKPNSLHASSVSHGPPALPARPTLSTTSSSGNSGISKATKGLLDDDVDLDTPLETFSVRTQTSTGSSVKSNGSTYSTSSSQSFTGLPSTSTSTRTSTSTAPVLSTSTSAGDRRADFPSASLPKVGLRAAQTFGGTASFTATKPPALPARPTLDISHQGGNFMSRSASVRSHASLSTHSGHLGPALPPRPNRAMSTSSSGAGSDHPASLLDDDDGEKTLNTTWKALA